MSGIMERRRKMQEEFKNNCVVPEWVGEVDMEEVKKHNSDDDCWVIFKGDVYNITQYLGKHPGGSSCFRNPNQRDITQMFMAIHPHADASIIEKLKIGTLKPSNPNPETNKD